MRIGVDQGVEYGIIPGDGTPGALRTARNVFYEPESSVLQQIWYRSLFGTIASGQTPKGLGFAQFRSGSKYLVGTAGDKIAAAPVGSTGTFTVLKTLAAQAGRMEQAYYNLTDRLYLSDGVNAPQVWDGGASTRDMGLTAPSTAPTVTLVTNGSTIYPVGATFQYLYTEYDSVNLVESGPSPTAVVALDTTGQTIRLVIPTKENSSADTFRIYRTVSGGNVWYRLAEIDATKVRYYDGEDTEALGDATDNLTEWGFITFDDIFLAGQQTMPMIGEPLRANYITVNGTVPRGDIMCFYQGCLVIGGVSGYGQHLYYSLPDNPECFSPVYYLAVENDYGDPVKGMGIGNDRLIVGTVNSIYRYDRLPFVTDPGWGLGLASKQEVTRDHGFIAKRAVAQYSVGYPNNRLFYLSTRGPYSTDGYTTVPLGRDLDWSNRAINFAAIGNAVAVNWPKYRVIILCLPSASSTVNDIAFIYHYDPSHQKRASGVGKWTGPIDIYAAAAAVSRDADTETRLYLADGRANGQVYLEEDGTTDASQYKNASGDVTFEWETDDRLLSDPTRQGYVQRAFVQIGGTVDFDATLKVAMDKRDEEYDVHLENLTYNEEATETLGTSTITKTKGRTLRGDIYETGTHIRLHMEETGSGLRRSVVGVDIEVSDRGPQR